MASHRQTLAPLVTRIGRQTVTRQFSEELYGGDFGRSAVEIIRNGMVACMGDHGGWDPARIAVDVALVKHHPLIGTNALCVSDAGTGFTKADLERFCILGTDEDRTRHAGGQQKGLGRLACFALSGAPRDAKTFSILTRTSSRGKVMHIVVTSRSFSDQRIERELFEPDATELGSYAGYEGRFSSVIIPTPVFRSHEEIRTAVGPWLPRKRDYCGAFTIGGRAFVPPPLADRVIFAQEDVPIEAYLAPVERAVHGGLWLADRTTGFRVAFAPNCSVHLPYPLGRLDLVGDIFLPGLLEQQDTGRSGLTTSFLRSKAWRTIADHLQAHVTPLALDLLEGSDVVSGSPITDLITGDIRTLFQKAWGEPTDDEPPPFRDDGIEFVPPSGPSGPKSPRKPRPPTGNPTDRKPGKPRFVRLKIGEETWIVGSTRDDPLRFAVIQNAQRRCILVNKEYAATPRKGAGLFEHSILALLGTIGQAKFPRESDLAQRFVAERRRELLEA